MVYGKWLDFYMHVVWRSRTSGVLQIWYRVDGQKKFTKLYSDVPGDRALIQVPPHPTLLYNTENGAPGENGKPGPRARGRLLPRQYALDEQVLVGRDEAAAKQGGDLAGFPGPAALIPSRLQQSPRRRAVRTPQRTRLGCATDDKSRCPAALLRDRLGLRGLYPRSSQSTAARRTERLSRGRSWTLGRESKPAIRGGSA